MKFRKYARVFEFDTHALLTFDFNPHPNSMSNESLFLILFLLHRSRAKKKKKMLLLCMRCFSIQFNEKIYRYIIHNIEERINNTKSQ